MFHLNLLRKDESKHNCSTHQENDLQRRQSREFESRTDQSF